MHVYRVLSGPLPSSKAPPNFHCHGLCITLFSCHSLSLSRAIPLDMCVELWAGAWVTQWLHLYLNQRFLLPQQSAARRRSQTPWAPPQSMTEGWWVQFCVALCWSLQPLWVSSWEQCHVKSQRLGSFVLLPIVESLHSLLPVRGCFLSLRGMMDVPLRVEHSTAIFKNNKSEINFLIKILSSKKNNFIL